MSSSDDKKPGSTLRQEQAEATFDVTTLSSETYWVFETIGIEALYIAAQMSKSLGELKPESGDVVMTLSREGDWPTYYIRRSRLPAAVVSKHTGIALEKLAAAKHIRLQVKQRGERLPASNYHGIPPWGTA